MTAFLGPNVIAVIASGHRIILFSPNMIVVSDKEELHLSIGNDVEDFKSSIRPLCCFGPTLIDVGIDFDELSMVENLLITMFNGSTNLAMQLSSGEKIIDLGLKS